MQTICYDNHDGDEFIQYKKVNMDKITVFKVKFYILVSLILHLLGFLTHFLFN